jgi:hypothetical protein
VRLLAYVTGSVNQELLLQNEYLTAENRILRTKLPARLRLSDPERVTLAEIGKRVGRKARREKRLLRRVQVGAVERGSTRHAAHRKHLQLDSFAAEISVGFVPIHLRFGTPGIALRNAGFASHQSQCDLPVVHVLAHGPLRNLARGQLIPDPCPDAVRRVPLLARRFSVGFQNRIEIKATLLSAEPACPPQTSS